jgi:hypothetical protein
MLNLSDEVCIKLICSVKKQTASTRERSTWIIDGPNTDDPVYASGRKLIDGPHTDDPVYGSCRKLMVWPHTDDPVYASGRKRNIPKSEKSAWKVPSLMGVR